MSLAWDNLCEFMAKNSFPNYYVFEDERGVSSIIEVGSEEFAIKFFNIKQQPKYRVYAIKPNPVQNKQIQTYIKLAKWDKLTTLMEEIKLKHILNEQF